MWLLLVLVLVPLIEIALFVTLGGFLGLFWTLGIVIGSAAMGALVIRREHRVASAGLRATLNERRDLSRSAALAAMGLAAGFLLMAPGFMTDTLGLLLLIPAIRHVIFRWFTKSFGESYVVFTGMRAGTRPSTAGDDIIEGEVVDRGAGADGPEHQTSSALPDVPRNRVNRRH